MGHPHNALDWLKRHAAAHGRPLREGDIVSTGSLVETRWVQAGDTVAIEIAGLGNVTVLFTAA
jgi:2-oxo-3-hexenedioate decarboxylase/2-keto-4-pentenoate hydratase